MGRWFSIAEFEFGCFHQILRESSKSVIDITNEELYKLWIIIIC